MKRLVFWDVDTQRDFMEPDGALYVPGAEEIVDNLRRLTDHARGRQITVVASVDDHTPEDPEISVTPDFRATFPAHCLRGSRGQEKIPATRLDDPVVIENRTYADAELLALLPARGGAVVIKKQALDVLSNPATTPLIRLLDPDPVVVYGVAAEFCVNLAVAALLRAERRVYCVADAMRAVDPAAGARCAERWKQSGAVLTTTGAVLAGI
jgi:nicotinamidase/pyrazinamidase